MNQIRKLEECMVDAIESIGNEFDCLIIADNRSEKMYRSINIIDDNIYTLSDLTRRDKKWVENNFKDRRVLVYGDILTARNDIIYYYLLAKVVGASKVRLKVFALDTSYNVLNGVKYSGIKLGGNELWEQFNMSETILSIEKYMDKTVELSANEANELLKDELIAIDIPKIIGTSTTDRVVTTFNKFKTIWNNLPEGYEAFKTYSSLSSDGVLYCIRITNTLSGNKYSELVNECIISCKISTNKNLVVYEPIMFMKPVDVDSVKSIIDIYGSKKIEYSSDNIDYYEIMQQLKQNYFVKFIEVIKDILRSNPDSIYTIDREIGLNELDLIVLNKSYDLIGSINIDLELTELYLLVKKGIEDISDDEIKSSILKAIMTLVNDNCCQSIIARREDKYEIGTFIRYDVGSKIFINIEFKKFYKILHACYSKYGLDNKKINFIEKLREMVNINNNIHDINRKYLLDFCDGMLKKEVLKKFILAHEYIVNQ